MLSPTDDSALSPSNDQAPAGDAQSVELASAGQGPSGPGFEAAPHALETDVANEAAKTAPTVEEAPAPKDECSSSETKASPSASSDVLISGEESPSDSDAPSIGGYPWTDEQKVLYTAEVRNAAEAGYVAGWGYEALAGAPADYMTGLADTARQIAETPFGEIVQPVFVGGDPKEEGPAMMNGILASFGIYAPEQFDAASVPEITEEQRQSIRAAHGGEEGGFAEVVDEAVFAAREKETPTSGPVFADPHALPDPPAEDDTEEATRGVEEGRPDEPTDAIEEAARAAHEANREYCFTMGDDSQLPWDEAPEWQKESARAGVRAIAANPLTTPEESHIGWMALKHSEGWTYGPVKDPEAKRHPCMVPYGDLPEEQRAKDTIFGRTVRAVLGLPEPAPEPTRDRVYELPIRGLTPRQLRDSQEDLARRGWKYRDAADAQGKPVWHVTVQVGDTPMAGMREVGA